MARGDHLFVDCGAYSHHGIDCGDGQVIHFDFAPKQKLRSLLGAFERSEIRKSDISVFSGEREILIREYDHERNIDEIMARAESRLGESGYRLFDNNCEHFAHWCQTGESRSTQVDAARKAAVPFFGGVLASSFLRFSPLLPPHARLVVSGAALSATVGNAAARYFAQRQMDRHNGRS